MNDDLQPGTLLAGKYRIERVIGAGGMGVVLAAVQEPLGRVAVKVLNDACARNPEAVARFVREGIAARRLRSEHAVRVTDVGVLPVGAPYLVMEWLDGKDLSALVRDAGPLPVADAVELVLQAGEALAEAHAQGIIHRDIKPANLFLTAAFDGTPCLKVLDFGISKFVEGIGEAHSLTATTGMMGTALYASPEQLRAAKQVDARSDLWSLGATMFELLTGRPPFVAESLGDLVFKVAAGPPDNVRALRPEVPEGLARAVARCLERDLAARCASIGELAALLAPFAPSRARVSVERIARIDQAHGYRRSVFPVDAAPTLSAPAGSAPLAATTTAPASRAVAEPALPSAAATTRSRAWRVPAALVGLLAMGVGGVVAIHPRAPAAQPVSTATAEAAASVREATPDASPTPTVTTVTVEEPRKPVDLAPKPAAAPAAKPTAKPATASATTSASASASSTTAAPTASAPAPPPPKLDCNPTYFLDKDGIEHHKPGCN